MSAVEAFQPHMLLSAVVHTIFYQFSFNIWPVGPPKSRFSVEKVVIFEVCAIFASDALCDVSWGPFRTVGGSPGTLFAASLKLFEVSCGPLGGLFRRVCVLWVVFAMPWAPGCARELPKRPQERPPKPSRGRLEASKRRPHRQHQGFYCFAPRGWPGATVSDECNKSFSSNLESPGPPRIPPGALT